MYGFMTSHEVNIYAYIHTHSQTTPMSLALSDCPKNIRIIQTINLGAKLNPGSLPLKIPRVLTTIKSEIVLVEGYLQKGFITQL